MALYIKYRVIYVSGFGHRAYLELWDRNGGSDIKVWEGNSTPGGALPASPFTWDSTGNCISASATKTWSCDISRTFGYVDTPSGVDWTTVQKFTGAVNRNNNTIVLTPIYKSGYSGDEIPCVLPINGSIVTLEFTQSPIMSSFSDYNTVGTEIEHNKGYTVTPPSIGTITRQSGNSLQLPLDVGGITATGATRTLSLVRSLSEDMSNPTFLIPSFTGSTSNYDDTSLAKNSTYYYRFIVTWTFTHSGKQLQETAYSSVVSCSTAIVLSAPGLSLSGVTNGSGTASWNAVPDAVAYWLQRSDTSDFASPTTISDSLTGTSTTFTSLGGKYLRLKAVASSTPQYAYESSAWSSPVQVPVGGSGVDSITNRVDFLAIPRVHVDVEQIGTYENDVITKEYADLHYYSSMGEVPADSLPFMDGATPSSSKAHIVSPYYLNEAIDGIELAGSITELTISTTSGAPNVGGVATTINGNVEDYTLATRRAVYNYVDSCSTVSSNTPGKLVKLDGQGKISNALLQTVSISNFYTAASQPAMTSLSQAEQGDICIRTDLSKTFILMSDAATGYSDPANWVELVSPTNVVTSIAGKNGAVTLSDIGLETTLTASSDVKFPSSKAVATYVSGQITALSLGAASKKNVSSGVAIDDGNLVTGGQVYTYVAGLNLSDTYAAKSHTHTLGHILWTGTTCYSAGTTISSTSTDGQLATGLAVYTFVNGFNFTSKLTYATYSSNTDNTTNKVVNPKYVSDFYSALPGSAKRDVATTLKSSDSGYSDDNLVPSSFFSNTKLANYAVKYNDNGMLDVNAIGVDNEMLVRVSNSIQVGQAFYDYIDVMDRYYRDSALNRTLRNGLFPVTYNGYPPNDTLVPVSATCLVGDNYYRCHQQYTVDGNEGGSSSQPFSYYWTQINIGSVNRVEATITGDGVKSTFEVYHGLNYRDVSVVLVDDDTHKEVYASIQFISTVKLSIGFGFVLASGKKYRVVIRR